MFPRERFELREDVDDVGRHLVRRASDEGVERLLRGVRIAHGVQGERERLWNLGFVRETLEEDVEVFERASGFADVAVELRLREAVLVILGVQQERLVEARQRAPRVTERS